MLGLNIGAREKKLILVLVSIVVLYLLYIFWQNGGFFNTDEINQSIADKKETLNWLPQKAQEIEALKRSERKYQDIPGSILGFLDTKAHEGKLKDFPVEISQGPNDTVRMEWNKVPFDVWAHWLGDIHWRYGLDIVQVSILRNEKVTGEVSVTLLLQKH